jgi:hypothetical protein
MKTHTKKLKEVEEPQYLFSLSGSCQIFSPSNMEPISIIVLQLGFIMPQDLYHDYESYTPPNGYSFNHYGELFNAFNGVALCR